MDTTGQKRVHTPWELTHYRHSVFKFHTTIYTFFIFTLPTTCAYTHTYSVNVHHSSMCCVLVHSQTWCSLVDRAMLWFHSSPLRNTTGSIKSHTQKFWSSHILQCCVSSWHLVKWIRTYTLNSLYTRSKQHVRGGLRIVQVVWGMEE